MANTLVQFRVEESQRKQASAICEALGIDLQTACRMLVARIIKEQGIPFSMSLDRKTDKEA